MTLWAIEWRTNDGEWRIDHTTVRFLRKDAWAEWERVWRDGRRERKKYQRAGKLRAVKVRVERA